MIFKKGLGAHKAGIHVTFKEHRFVKIVSTDMPHQFELKLCEVEFDMGLVKSITPLDFNIQVTDLDSTEMSEIMTIWENKLQNSIEKLKKATEEALNKPCLEVKG